MQSVWQFYRRIEELQLGGLFTHLVGGTVWLFAPNPLHHHKTVQEVRLDDITQKGGLALLVDQSYYVIANVSFSL